jgi:hypothetical protein
MSTSSTKASVASKDKPAKKIQKVAKVKTTKAPALHAGADSANEDCVASCIHAQQPTVVIAPEFTMSALGVNTTVLGSCLNTRCSIPEGKRFAGGEIKGSWSVGRVRAEASKRGTC